MLLRLCTGCALRLYLTWHLYLYLMTWDKIFHRMLVHIKPILWLVSFGCSEFNHHPHVSVVAVVVAVTDSSCCAGGFARARALALDSRTKEQ
jgi:hypothetical protein